jgi:exoribonuclease R
MSQQYRISITDTDRSYNSCKLYEHNSTNNQEIPNTLIPLAYELFHNDIIEFDKNKVELVNIIHSPTRTAIMPGVLILENNNTFGRTENKKRLLYKCFPADKHLPVFLIPYDIKLDFHKQLINKYILFKYEHWNDKHPRGIITETIGDVDKLEPFYEYQLYCKNLQISLTQFTQKTRKIDITDAFIETIFKNTKIPIEDRRDQNIITIDPENSLDFDDGISIKPTITGSVQTGWIVSVYISNVFFWLETHELWQIMTERISTIYLPDKKRPMLPPILSDNLCSLQQNTLRIAMVMDVQLDMSGNPANENHIQYKNALINVSKNYVYEDHKLINKDKMYKNLFILSQLMDNKIKDSHDVVAHWMVLMNLYTGQLLKQNQCGIFRTATYKDTITKIIPNGFADETRRMIQMWNNINGSYVVFQENVKLEHDLIEPLPNNTTSTYIQITSPIRRLIDVLNQIILYKVIFKHNISNNAEQFLQKWLGQMENINTTMKTTRKIQTDCVLLTQITKHPEIKNQRYNGVVIDRTVTKCGKYQYMIYLEKLKLVSRVKTDTEIILYSNVNIQLYLFEDEDKLKRKIRAQIM